MKLQRYEVGYDIDELYSYRKDNGDWCKDDDVARLEASHAELEYKHEELIDDIRDVLESLPANSYWASQIGLSLERAIDIAEGKEKL